MLESQPRLQSRTISILPAYSTTNPSNSPDSSTKSSFSSQQSNLQSAQSTENVNAIYLFVLVAFSYMVPWTAVGSLIDYYTNTYGKNYYVYLNLAFYGVGYPVSLLQQRIDLYFDIIYGSKQTFQGRLYFSFTFSLLLLLSLSFLNGIFYIIAIIGIGFTTWSAHGCASTLAGLIKFDSPILQQIGFVLPGLFSILMIFTLPLDLKGDSDISLEKKLILFSCACCCSWSCGLVLLV